MNLLDSQSLSDVPIMDKGSSVLLDMKQAVFNRTPFPYRVGNSTLYVQTRFVSFVALGGLMVLTVLFLALPLYHFNTSNLTNNLWSHGEEHGHGHGHKNWFSYYNNTYPLTPPIYSARGYGKYRIAIISDLDTNSKHSTKENTWISYLKKGYVTINIDNLEVMDIEWDKELIPLTSSHSHGGRGMELSELVVFNGKLYAPDDRTGIIFEIDLKSNTAYPWVVLNDGNGRELKGFKSEWAAVKDETLIIGGLGKEWTSATGEIVNHNPEWVKTVSTKGYIEHHDWTKNYEKLRETAGLHFPGYLIHESCAWSDMWQRWVFLPRRASLEPYDEKTDEHKGTNLMLQASEGFEDVKLIRVGEIIDTHGFSSFKFIPGTNDKLIIAIKSEEVEGKVASYVLALDIFGNVVFPEKKIDDFKFEGVEFI